MKKKYWIIAGLVLAAAAVAIWFFFFKKPKVEYREHTIKKSGITLKVLTTCSVQP
jgi:hypothetical protein